MVELLGGMEMLEQLEMTEEMEFAEQQKELAHKIEMNQKWYQKALNEGSADMADYFQKEIDTLKAEKNSVDEKMGTYQGVKTEETSEEGDYHQGERISFEGKLSAHQGMAPEETSDEGDYHQGKQISFGKSIKDCEKTVRHWDSELEARTKRYTSDIKNGRDVTDNKLDMESAQRQLKSALRDLEWAKKHQK